MGTRRMSSRDENAGTRADTRNLGGMDMVMLGKPSRQYNDPYAAADPRDNSFAAQHVEW